MSIDSFGYSKRFECMKMNLSIIYYYYIKLYIIDIHTINVIKSMGL